MKVLLIGCGRWGQNYIPRLSLALGTENVILCDLDMTRIAHYANPKTVDYLSVLDSVHAVVVATLPETHYRLGLDVLAAGKHLLVEKPMALSRVEATAMMLLALKKNVVLQTDSTWEYEPRATALTEELSFRTDRRITFYWSNPRPGPLPKEGILWTQGPHPLALMLDVFCNQAPISVEGIASPAYADLRYHYGKEESARVVMDWGSEQKTRLIHAESRGLKGMQLDIVDLVPQPFGRLQDPLDRMLAAFFERTKAAVQPWASWRDTRGERVVEVLDWTAQQLSRPASRPARHI